MTSLELKSRIKWFKVIKISAGRRGFTCGVTVLVVNGARAAVEAVSTWYFMSALFWFAPAVSSGRACCEGHVWPWEAAEGQARSVRALGFLS